jgi:serine/threonine-protein kinase
VTDFGIARSLDVESFTQSGTVLGTSSYIAPEQATGHAVDVRTDVYSLGVVLFELLTGDVPFGGESFVAVAMQQIHDPAPSVLDRRPDVPPRVALAVDRALEKEPAARFQSMDAFADELEACLRELQGEAAEDDTLVAPVAPRHRPRRAVAPRSRIPFVLVAAGVVLLAAAVAGVLVARDEDGGSPASAGASGRVELSGVGSFDPPPGDGREHDERVAEATDGDAATSWTTERYNDFAKPGVGLVLDATRAVVLTQLTVVTDTPGFTAFIRSGDSPEGTRIVSPSRNVGATTTFPVSSGPARYYVVWITNLGPNRAVHVNEVRAS